MQRALSAQQVYGSSEALVIPIPEVDDIQEKYDILYKDDFKPTKQYIHLQGMSLLYCVNRACFLRKIKGKSEKKKKKIGHVKGFTISALTTDPGLNHCSCKHNQA